MNKYRLSLFAILLSSLAGSGWTKEIIHDAEYNVIKAQNGERWDADDKQIDKKLAELRKYLSPCLVICPPRTYHQTGW